MWFACWRGKHNTLFFRHMETEGNLICLFCRWGNWRRLRDGLAWQSAPTTHSTTPFWGLVMQKGLLHPHLLHSSPLQVPTMLEAQLDFSTHLNALRCLHEASLSLTPSSGSLQHAGSSLMGTPQHQTTGHPPTASKHIRVKCYLIRPP